MTERTNITRNNFFAWSLYTAYRNVCEIGNWVAAEWPGKKITNAQDMQDDIDFRVDMLIEAFKVAIANTDNCNDWVRYFVVPEFYFHSAHGPYPGLSINDKSAFEYIMSQLSVRIKSTLADSSEAKKDWVICTGGVLTTHVDDIESFLAGAEVQKRLTKLNDVYTRVIEQNPKLLEVKHIGLMRLKSLESSLKQDVTSKGAWDEFNKLVNAYRQDPLCTVRNRAGIFVYNGGSTGEIIDYSVEKQAESTVDLTIGHLKDGLIYTDGQITEWMANYPPINITGGDNQNSGTKAGARLPIVSYNQNVELGVEICLDHRLQRLRRNVNMEGNSPIDIQLVPSGGMQLLDYAIATGSSGAIFNADGCGFILDKYDDTGTAVISKDGKACSGTIKQVITGVYTSSTQTCSEGTDGKPYYSHSQLAYRTDEGGPSDYINPQGIENAGGPTYIGTEEHPSNQYLDLYSLPSTKPVTVLNRDDKINIYFTAGLGEIHQYSTPK